MNPIQEAQALARSDVRPPVRTTAGDATAPTAGTTPYRRQGMLLTTGALAWVAAQLAVGSLAPSDSSGGLLVFGLGSGLFQLGLLGLLTVLFRTQALGSGRWARFFLRLEAVLISFAIASTVVDMFGISDLEQTGWAILDAFWPLSMLGMFFIGIRIAVAGRWTGVSRFWPLVAESLAVVTIPTLGIAGPTAALVVSSVHLCVGYAVLGQIVARKQG